MVDLMVSFQGGFKFNDALLGRIPASSIYLQTQNLLTNEFCMLMVVLPNYMHNVPFVVTSIAVNSIREKSHSPIDLYDLLL